MTSKKKYIVDVVPLTRIPLSRDQAFFYLSDKKISRGSLVKVPLFYRTIEGIALGTRKDFPRFGNIKLKKVTELVLQNFVTEEQIQLAKWVSEYYFCSLGIVLKHFVPKRVKERTQLVTRNWQRGKRKVILTKKQEDVVHKIANHESTDTSYYLLHGAPSSGKTEVYCETIVQLQRKNKNAQALILLPELILTPQALERYLVYFKRDAIVVIHSKVSKGEFYSSWQKIQSGEAKVIIGTRSALFAPFQKLSLIVIDEAHDKSFKQWDGNPRYDARQTGLMLARIHNATVIFGTATPRVEDYYTAKKSKTLLTLPSLGVVPRVAVVPMFKERWQKNFSPLSRTLQVDITETLRKKKQTILFINRQGMSAFSVCTECKTILLCPTCDRALVYDGTKGQYHCLHCEFHTQAFPKCKKCFALTFQHVGLGTQKIEKEARKFFPSARIARADAQTMKKRGAMEHLQKDFSSGKIDILVGTQMITKGWDLPRVLCVAIIDADMIMHLPDFRSSEETFQHIMQTAGRVMHAGKKQQGIVVIQTFNPLSESIQSSISAIGKQEKEKEFYEKDLAERKTFFYPPYGKFIKLLYQHTKVKKVDEASSDVYQKLLQIVNNHLSTIIISEPHEPLVSNVRGRHRKQIIIKIKEGDVPKELQKFLQQRDPHWIIDVDPVSIV